MSIGTDFNNPFDLRPDSRWTWRGQLPSDGKQNFCIFDTLEDGLRAGLLNLLNTVRAGYNTISKLAYHYAPPEENDTQAYIQGLCASTGWYADERLTLDGPSLLLLGKAVLSEEQGSTYVASIDFALFGKATTDALSAS